MKPSALAWWIGTLGGGACVLLAVGLSWWNGPVTYTNEISLPDLVNLAVAFFVGVLLTNVLATSDEFRRSHKDAFSPIVTAVERCVEKAVERYSGSVAEPLTRSHGLLILADLKAASTLLRQLEEALVAGAARRATAEARTAVQLLKSDLSRQDAFPSDDFSPDPTSLAKASLHHSAVVIALAQLRQLL